jgi:hypothetical protein
MWVLTTEDEKNKFQWGNRKEKKDDIRALNNLTFDWNKLFIKQKLISTIKISTSQVEKSSIAVHLIIGITKIHYNLIFYVYMKFIKI